VILRRQLKRRYVLVKLGISRITFSRSTARCGESFLKESRTQPSVPSSIGTGLRRRRRPSSMVGCTLAMAAIWTRMEGPGRCGRARNAAKSVFRSDGAQSSPLIPRPKKSPAGKFLAVASRYCVRSSGILIGSCGAMRGAATFHRRSAYVHAGHSGHPHVNAGPRRRLCVGGSCRGRVVGERSRRRRKRCGHSDCGNAKQFHFNLRKSPVQGGYGNNRKIPVTVPSKVRSFLREKHSFCT
jgi:hypothetical protein